jgi:hypothetical protein
MRAIGLTCHSRLWRAATPIREKLPQRASQPLLKIIEALHLLREARGGAHQRRASLEPAQALAKIFQATAHASFEPQAQVVE